MDGGAAVEFELDPFSSVLPLPFRVASIIVLGVWAWGLNLHYLHLIRIDVPALIRYPARGSQAQTSHHLSTYRFATFLTVPLAVTLVLFWLLTWGHPEYVIKWQVLPNLYLIFLPISFFLPIRSLSQNGRYRFLTTLRRVSIGGIAEEGKGRFGDILMGDVLTSYAKVFGDLFIALCMLVTAQHTTAQPDRTCGGDFIVPFIISVPSLIRLRQCLIDYGRVRRAIAAGGSSANGWGGAHLGNAVKYTSALPVIILSALQRGYDSTKMGISEATLFRLWLVAVYVNSFYSFYWDVAKDWDLTLFSSEKLRNPPPDPVTKRPEYPYGLRRHRYFHAPGIYYTVIFIDLLLRCTWSFKLSPHLDHFNDLEGGIFLMELLEVFRRWMWVFFRVETEWVRRNKEGPAPDDILLGEYHGRNKYDDEDD